ncbi:MAG: type II toxin-antitoxin system PemK/MazF family toxin [Gammaproteobacteria bacterium]|nr:type II toxin-antitoxin system PemK/MazF family toxin [Gammaproteobacteria bacterium]
MATGATKISAGLVVSPVQFNDHFGIVFIAPITSRIRGHGFGVKLESLKTEGVVLCQQAKVIVCAEGILKATGVKLPHG